MALPLLRLIVMGSVSFRDVDSGQWSLRWLRTWRALGSFVWFSVRGVSHCLVLVSATINL